MTKNVSPRPGEKQSFIGFGRGVVSLRNLRDGMAVVKGLRMLGAGVWISLDSLVTGSLHISSGSYLYGHLLCVPRTAGPTRGFLLLAENCVLLKQTLGQA